MCTAIRVLYGWPSVMRGRRSMRGRRPMAKWIKVDTIRSLQIRRRLAPGTRFKRSFECSVPAPRSPMLRMPCGASPRTGRSFQVCRKGCMWSSRDRAAPHAGFSAQLAASARLRRRGLAPHGTRSMGDRGVETGHSKERLKRAPGAKRRRI